MLRSQFSRPLEIQRNRLGPINRLRCLRVRRRLGPSNRFRYLSMNSSKGIRCTRHGSAKRPNGLIAPMPGTQINVANPIWRKDKCEARV
jgi:hypothetical protein